MVGGTRKNAINKLGEAQIQAFVRKAKAGTADKTKLADGGGMYLTLTENTLRVLYAHIEKVQMADQFSLTPEMLDGLPPRLRLAYEAWKNGKDMRQLLPLRTYYRYRKELLERGIDISVRQPAQSDNVIPLVRALRPQAIAQVPDWAKGTPIYFEPQRKAARSRIKTTASCSSPKSFLVLERRAERWTVGVPR